MQRTIKLIVLLVLSTLAALFFSSCGGGSAPAADNKVAATVNGKPILMSEVEQQITQQTQGKQAQLPALVLAQARLQALDGLIQKEVLFQRAEKENLKPTEDELNQYLTQQKTQAGMTEEEFQKHLKEQGLTETSLREEARKLLAIQKLQTKYTGNVAISDREVEEYYTANKQQFTIGRGVELADIVVDPTDNGLQDDAKTEAEAKLKIDTIFQNLKNADFAEVARERSEDQSNVKGGDIGFATEDDLKKNGFPPTLIAQLFGPTMQVGNYTEPVQFNGRWYIFKLKRKQLETENRTLESSGVRPEITEALRSQRQQLLNTALVEVSLSEARIVNNLATEMVNNPNNLGLRPASSQAGASPAPSAAASVVPTAAPKATTPAASVSPAASPAKK